MKRVAFLLQDSWPSLFKFIVHSAKIHKYWWYCLFSIPVSSLIDSGDMYIQIKPTRKSLWIINLVIKFGTTNQAFRHIFYILDQFLKRAGICTVLKVYRVHSHGIRRYTSNNSLMNKITGVSSEGNNISYVVDT